MQISGEGQDVSEAIAEGCLFSVSSHGRERERGEREHPLPPLFCRDLRGLGVQATLGRANVLSPLS